MVVRRLNGLRANVQRPYDLIFSLTHINTR